MLKLVALEQIKGLFSRIVYAEKYDEVKLLINRIDVSQYKNLRTGELIDARHERIGLVDEKLISAYIPEKEKKVSSAIIHKVSGKTVIDNKQQSLF